MIQHQHIYAAALKGAKGLLGGIDNWLTFQIEGGIEQYRHPCGLAKTLNELIVTWVGSGADSLQPARAIDVRDRREHLALLRLDIHDVQHEARRVVPGWFGQDEILPRMLRQDGWGEGAEGLSELDLGVDDVLHVG